MLYPKILRIRQQFERPRVDNVPLAVRSALEQLDLGRTIRPGQSVALTAGSRGIANIPLVLRSVATFLKDLGAHPFLVPAMGSHGGGTAEGQRKVLESYGITEEFVGRPSAPPWTWCRSVTPTKVFRSSWIGTLPRRIISA